MPEDMSSGHYKLNSKNIPFKRVLENLGCLAYRDHVISLGCSAFIQ